MVMMSQNRVFRDVYATFVVYLGTLVIGLDDSFTAYFVAGQEDVTIAKEAVAGSIGLFFRAMGSFLGIGLIDRIGRVHTLRMSLIVYIVAWSAILGSATSLTALYVGRALSGIATGLQFSSIIYVTEVCHENIRGRLLAMRILFLALGNSLSVIIIYFSHWQVVAIIVLIIVSVDLFLISFLPETKFWYVSKGLREKAEESLLWFSRTTTPEQTDYELDRLERLFCRRKPAASACNAMQKKDNVKPFIICTLLNTLTIGTGRSAFLSHSQHFFMGFQSAYESKKLVFLFGVTDIIACFMYIIVADKFKRTTMMHGTLAFMAIVLIGILFHDVVLWKLHLHLPILPVALLYVYLLLCLTGLHTGISGIISDIAVNANRGVIANTVASVSVLTGGFYAYILPYVLEKGDVRFILLFFLFNVVSIEAIVRFCVPETLGNKLHECVRLDDDLSDIVNEVDEEEILLFVSTNKD